MASKIKCMGCENFIKKDINYCPICGTQLKKIENNYVFESMDSYASMSEENLSQFLELMENPEKLKEKIQEEEKTSQLFKKQKKLTQSILDRFPEIKRYILENPKVEFNAFIISMPYEKESGILQHDCLLRQLAINQNGLVNFSLGSTQLATDLYAFDVPVWAPKRIGHGLLLDQQKQINKCMPDSQKKFLYCAEPWWVCSKVFDLDGRWVNWRLLFKTEGFKEYTEEREEVPLNFHVFSNMGHSDLFSIAGTHGDGEVLVGIYGKGEKKIFKKHLSELQKLYEFGKSPEVKTIKISWDTLESLGLIGFSAQQLLQSKGHFFRKTLSDKIIKLVEEKTVSETRKAMTGKSSSEDNFIERQTKRFLWYKKSEQQGGAVRITHGIPRESRKAYRVTGGKA